MSQKQALSDLEPKRVPVDLSPEQFEMLQGMQSRLYGAPKRAVIVRQLIEFLDERIKGFDEANPGAGKLSFEKVLAAYYDAGRERMRAEWAKADEQLEAYQRAQEIDGGLAAVDYKIAPKVIEFVHQCWAKGLSYKAVAAEAAEAQALARAQADERFGVHVDEPGALDLMPAFTPAK